MHAAAVRSAAAPVAIAERGGADDGHGTVTGGGAAVLFPVDERETCRGRGERTKGYVV